MEHEFEAQVSTQAGNKKQKQRCWAFVAWLIMILLTPVLSVPLLFYLLFYQFCLVGAKKLSAQAKAVTAVMASFFAISWIPVVTLTLYVEGGADSSPSDIANAVGPLGAFTIFCVWGSAVAFSHFTISDSYEPELERSNVKKLKELTIDPALLVDIRNLPEQLIAEVNREDRDGLERVGNKVIIGNARELYQVLKGDLCHTYTATWIAVFLAAATVTVVRMCAIEAPANGRYSEILYILSTVFFCGMFLVFYFTFGFVIIMYLHQVSFIQRLTNAIDDNAPPRQRFVKIEAMHLKQLRAWEECRRLAVEELTSNGSILNAIFFPSMLLSALSTVLIFSYLVASLLFLRSELGPVSLSLIILLAVLVGFMTICIGIAKIAQKHFKRHSALIAQKTFDISRQIDVFHTNLEQGIEEDEDMSIGGRKVAGVVHQVAWLSKSSSGGERSGANGEPVSLLTMEQIYASLHSLCTFMIANQPRPLILGIELRHVRFVVVFLMLISGNILFVSLMVAFKHKKCGNT